MANGKKVKTMVIRKDEHVHDNVNHPEHYELAGMECIDVIIATQGIQAAQDFCICNALKYIFRHRMKNGLEDVQKAQWYINKYLELEERKEQA